MLKDFDLDRDVSNAVRELKTDELDSVGGGGFASAGAGVGAAGAGARQVDFFTLYYDQVYQPAPVIFCGDGVCA